MAPGTEAIFACSDAPSDREFLEKEGLQATPVAPRTTRIWHVPWCAVRALRLLLHVRPDVVFCKGGAISFTITAIAWLLRIPVVAHESDSVMGKTSMVTHIFSMVTCRGMPDIAGHRQSQNRRAIFTGNPVRPSVTQGTRERGLFIAGFDGSRPILLVYGGSQGAEALNQAVRKQLDALLAVADVIHLTGKGKEGRATLDRRYHCAPFAYNDLPHLYAIADLALSRSGAGAISELAACGIPVVLVPLQGLAHDHQKHNADVAARLGGAVVLEQSSLDTGIREVIVPLLLDENKRRSLSERWNHFGSRDAADQIASLLLKLGASRQ
jgi:UDP-N-acetylglucosamine--N-acetylmuramyl-(pentapeptide) pyrophosphoryl-undecaprenol N-acetylglucosamine transferase